MKNTLQKKKSVAATVQVHVVPPLIPLIEIKNDEKSDKEVVKIKFHRDPTSENSALYELKIDFFDNNYPAEILLFIHNFKHDSRGVVNA